MPATTQKKPLRGRFLATAFSLLLLPSLGCMGHRNPADPIYELTQVDSQYFLVPGLSETQGQHQQFQMSLGRGGSDGRPFDQAACSIRGPWFSIYPVESAGTRDWAVETPSAKAWAEAGGHIDMKAEWDSFLQRLAILRERPCFAASEEMIDIKRKIVEGMAMPADEALLYRYSYGGSGYADLTAGMELRIERNLQTGNAEKSRRGISPLRTITTTYSFSSVGENGAQIHLIGSQDSSRDASGAFDFPDKTLATQFQAGTRLRLILQRLEVSADTRSPAILLSGSDIESLEAATKAAVDDRHKSCKDLANAQVTCAQFDGLVTVSPVLNVKVNGRLKYAPLGSKVWYVFPAAHGASPAIIRTLRIRRQFDGQYRDLEFARNDEEIGQILLFGGDEISWSKSAAK